MTIADLLMAEARRDGARPFLTWYDDGAGARVELSTVTTANWAVKIANFLLDEHALEPGDEVGVDPAPHWITAVVLLGTWAAGGHAVVGAAPLLEATYDAMGAGISRLVAAQPDRLVTPVVASAEPALTAEGRTWSHAELVEAAAQAARAHQLGSGSRVLTTLSFDTVDGLDAGLLAPLAGGASVVVVQNPDPRQLADRITAEHVTHSFTSLPSQAS